MHPEALKEQNKLIFAKLPEFTDFYLAGGTALALQIGHRVSVDFDLFSDREIKKTLLAEVKKTYSDFSEVEASVNNPDELTVFIDGVKLTFLYYPFPPLFEPVLYEGVKLLSIKEIAVTKAYTIGRRGSFKDYVDLYFILSEKNAVLEEIIEGADKKYGGEFNSRLFLEQLVYLSDVEDAEIEFLWEGPKDKIALENFFEEQVKKFTL